MFNKVTSKSVMVVSCTFFVCQQCGGQAQIVFIKNEQLSLFSCVCCLQLKWFDDPVVQCMRSVDVMDVKDVSLKRDFFGILPQAIPQFPRVTNS